MKFNPTKILTLVALTIFSESIFIGCSDRSGNTLAATNEATANLTTKNQISRFDPILRDAAQNANLDWKLLSAIAYAESRFEPNVRSRAGAVGLMQVMPQVARKQGVTVQEALDPQTNVSLAVYVLKTIESTLRFGKTPDDQKIKIMLAGYNSGIGNLIQARKLAVADGVNHNNWEVLKYYGAVNNSETRAFVNKVMNQWEHYKKLQ